MSYYDRRSVVGDTMAARFGGQVPPSGPRVLSYASRGISSIRALGHMPRPRRPHMQNQQYRQQLLQEQQLQNLQNQRMQNQRMYHQRNWSNASIRDTVYDGSRVISMGHRQATVVHLQRTSSSGSHEMTDPLTERFQLIQLRGARLGFDESPFFPRNKRELLDILTAAGRGIDPDPVRSLSNEIAREVRERRRAKAAKAVGGQTGKGLIFIDTKAASTPATRDGPEN